ncbi:MAG: hypothetical protein RL404_2613 [Pseudomonadota bacterium]|jgi:uncharacterized membrane protein
MAILVAGLLIFLATHSTRAFAPAWREAMIARLGKHAWRGLISVLSLVGFVMLIKGYDVARMNPIALYEPPLWLRPVTVLLMFFAAVFVAASIVPRNHIKAAMGHPLLLSAKTWAFAHLLSNGTLADLVLFGGFLLWAVPDFIRSRRSDRAQGIVYPEGGLGNTIVTMIVGAALWAVFAFYLHARWVGVAPLPL